MASNTAVYGLYKDRRGVEEAVDALSTKRFPEHGPLRSLPGQ